MTVDLDRAEQLAADLRQRPAATIRALVERVRELEARDATWMVREAEWVSVVSEQAGRVRALTDAGNTLAAVAAEWLPQARDCDGHCDCVGHDDLYWELFEQRNDAWRLLVDTADVAGEPAQTAQDGRNGDGDTGTGRRHHDGTGAHSVEAVPVEQLRAAIRLLYPDEMTPTAKRMFDSIIEAHTEPGEAIPQSPEAHDGTEAHEHKWELPDGPFRERLSVPPQQPYTCECGAHAWLTRAQTRP